MTTQRAEQQADLTGALRKIIITVVSGVVIMAATGYGGMQVALAQIQGQIDTINAVQMVERRALNERLKGIEEKIEKLTRRVD